MTAPLIGFCIVFALIVGAMSEHDSSGSFLVAFVFTLLGALAFVHFFVLGQPLP